MAMAANDGSPSLDVGKVKSVLTGRCVGRNIVYKQITGSTMDDARTLAMEEGYPHGTVVVAERQTQGRGAKDHKWDSSNSGNIYMSIVLAQPRHSSTFQGRFSLEVKACLAVLQAVHDLGVTKAVCKWPNDIWVRGHKLAGFLAEVCSHSATDPSNQETSLIILGIGINVNADSRRNAALARLATSLRCELGGKMVDRETFLANVCNHLEDTLDWSLAACLETFQHQNLFQSGMSVTVHDFQAHRNFEAVFSSIEDDWEVCLTDVPAGIGDEHGSVKGNSRRFSLRPCCTQNVFVCCGDAGPSPSVHAVCHALDGLVDSSMYNVDTLYTKQMTSDEWQEKTALLAVGDVSSLGVEERSMVEKSVQHQIKCGHPVLAIGDGALLLCQMLDPPIPSTAVQRDSDGDAMKIHIHSHVSNVSFTCISGRAPHTFNTPTGSSKMLASYVGRDGGDLGPSVVIVTTAQFGRVCLCGFSIELSSDALETGSVSVGVLQDGVFKRDALLSAMLDELLGGV